MTTIAYRDGILAADTLACAGGLKCGRVVKVFRLNDCAGPILVGAAGDQADCLKFVDWVRGGMDDDAKPTFYNDESRDSFSGIVVTKHGGVQRYWGDLFPRPMEAPFHAIGSGRDFAMGAMQMGATAVDAVRASIALDSNSGGDVLTVSLNGSA